MAVSKSFPPVAAPTARILILGSMPGKQSLREKQYYANPANSFWRIMDELFSIDHREPYRERLQQLKQAGIALWDVLESCERASSLDSDIVESSIRANDFSRFFLFHPRIQRVFFNGAKAEQVFRRLVLPTLEDELGDRFCYNRLPSTSPAHASMNFDAKLQAWRVITKN